MRDDASRPDRADLGNRGSSDTYLGDGTDGEPDNDEDAVEDAPPPPLFDDSITGEIAALIDDGRTYAQAEIAFQKVRAKLAGRSIAVVIACLVIGIVLLHIAFLALAVGLVMALEPLVTIWGAIAIVVGALLLLVLILGLKAKSSGQKLVALFTSDDEDSA